MPTNAQIIAFLRKYAIAVLIIIVAFAASCHIAQQVYNGAQVPPGATELPSLKPGVVYLYDGKYYTVSKSYKFNDSLDVELYESDTYKGN